MTNTNYDTLFNNDCRTILPHICEDWVSLILTSPPYDNLRDYNGGPDFELDEKLARHFYRILKDDGVMVWVVGDATADGSETCTSFKQVLQFRDVGFNLHDTMIYEKNSSTWPARRDGNRYTQIFEYMFVFSKGKPKAHLLCDKPNKWAGHKDFSKKFKHPVPSHSPRTNIWQYTTSFSGVSHPAPFPLGLATDHILSWTDPGDVVYDPFMGSGTTICAAKMAGRRFMGTEICTEYYREALQRVAACR